MPDEATNKFAVPIAIILAGALIAGAVYFTKDSSTAASKTTVSNDQKTEITMRKVSGDDHILGNPDADLIIVEYSDTECPFCKNFHSTLKQIIDEYGKDGKVAWVYRHFPLAQLHSKAPKEAEATECATELGGKSKFWDYVNRIYAITPSNNGLDPAQLPKIAEELGLNKLSFETCLSSGKYAAKVKADYDDAIASGGRGTPHSILVTKSGEKFPIEGAQPYESVKSLIESILKGQ